MRALQATEQHDHQMIPDHLGDKGSMSHCRESISIEIINITIITMSSEALVARNYQKRNWQSFVLLASALLVKR